MATSQVAAALCTAASVAMAKLRERWVLQDFGTLQFLVDTLATQVITLHGPGAITSDGPWELSVADDRQVLLSLDGQIDATEYMGTLATLVLEVDSKNEIVVLRDRTGSKPKENLDVWQKMHADVMVSKFLMVPVENFEKFQCEFFWAETPTLCGDKPVTLWMNFRWLLQYVFGKKGVDKAFRYAANFQKQLQKLGLATTHVVHTNRSERFRRTEEDERCGDKPDSKTQQEWRISVLAAILFLEQIAFTGHFARGEQLPWHLSEKAQALLSALLTWPRQGESDIAFALPETGCEILLRGMVVDHETLVESEAHIAKDKQIRIFGMVGRLAVSAGGC